MAAPLGRARPGRTRQGPEAPPPQGPEPCRTAAGFALGERIALRPGVALPDWSLLPDPLGREALAASMAVAGRREKWAGLSPAEDAAWQAVLRGLAGQAATGPGAPDRAGLLHALQRRDLLVLDAAGEVAAAYPFSANATPHEVVPDGAARPVHALCAIDALGAGGMLGLDAVIRSGCAECGAGIILRTCDHGHALASVEPGAAVIWSGIHYAGGCAATSGCAQKLFFCCDAHLESWRARVAPGGAGYRLSPATALQVGLALFVPMLDPGSASPAPAEPAR